MKRSENVLAQHHDLDYAMDRLIMLVMAPNEILDEARSRYILEREQRKLGKVILAHFDYEENEGYMGEVLLNAPQLARQVNALRKDHKDLRTLFQDLETESYDDGSLNHYKDSIIKALEKVRKHEQAENEVLQNYLVEELGRQGN